MTIGEYTGRIGRVRCSWFQAEEAREAIFEAAVLLRQEKMLIPRRLRTEL